VSARQHTATREITVTDTFSISETPLTDLALMGGLHERLVDALASDDSERAAVVAELVEDAINAALHQHGGWGSDGWEADDIVGPILDQVEEGLVNLTPHDVTLVGSDGAMVTLASCGRALVTFTPDTTLAEITVSGVTVPLVETAPGSEVTGIPLPAEGITYVVSQLAYDASRDRDDLCIPHLVVRGTDGQPSAAHALALPRR
jgi:hypothetical protein